MTGPLNILRRAQRRGYMAFGGGRDPQVIELMLALDAAQRVYDAALDDALAARRRPLVP